MHVERLEQSRMHTVSPPFDSGWDDDTKLDWKASIVELDCGVKPRVTRAKYSRKIAGEWIEQPNYFNVEGAGPMTWLQAWDFMNGFQSGIVAAIRGEVF